jgi:hypothetical protein
MQKLQLLEKSMGMNSARETRRAGAEAAFGERLSDWINSNEKNGRNMVIC